MNTLADARIFQGQIAKARNSTRNWPRGIVKNLGKRSVTSDPNGIRLAAMLVPRILNIQKNAQKKMPALAPDVQYRSSIAPRRSHGFHSGVSNAQLLLTAAVARMPSEAERVTARGLVKI